MRIELLLLGGSVASVLSVMLLWLWQVRRVLHEVRLILLEWLQIRVLLRAYRGQTVRIIERRSGVDRRVARLPYAGPDRRQGRDRRATALAAY
jgi:hypothetical protein